MSNNTVPVTVRIADKEYKISCPEGEHEALMSSARRVSEDMKKISEGGKALGAERIAVMAALNIANELFNEKETSTDPDVSARLDALQQSVDAALNTH